MNLYWLKFIKNKNDIKRKIYIYTPKRNITRLTGLEINNFENNFVNYFVQYVSINLGYLFKEKQ